MSIGVVEFLEVFGEDERFLVFAAASLMIALALFPLMKGACRATQILLCCGATLIVFAFVVLAPLSFLNLLSSHAELNPVSLNFNFGFLALGLGLFFKFRKAASPRR